MGHWKETELLETRDNLWSEGKPAPTRGWVYQVRTPGGGAPMAQIRLFRFVRLKVLIVRGNKGP